MKFVLMLQLALITLTSCGNWLQLDQQNIRMKDNTKAELVNDCLYRFTAAPGAEAKLLQTSIQLASDIHTTVHTSGQLLHGRLEHDATFKNDHASIKIPAFSTFTYSFDYKNCVFSFPESIHSNIQIGTNTNFDIYYQAIIYDNGDIASIAGSTTEFKLANKDLIFFKNDSIVIDATNGMNVHQKGVDEQNAELLEKLPMTPVKTYDKFLAYFYDGSNFRSQSFGGEVFYVYLDPSVLPIKQLEVNNAIAVEKALSETYYPKYLQSSYTNLIQIPLIPHSLNSTNKGVIYAYVHESQLNELDHLLEHKEPFIAKAAFGNFSNISKEGVAFISDLIGEEEYLNGFPSHDHSNCSHH